MNDPVVSWRAVKSEYGRSQAMVICSNFFGHKSAKQANRQNRETWRVSRHQHKHKHSTTQHSTLPRPTTQHNSFATSTSQPHDDIAFSQQFIHVAIAIKPHEITTRLAHFDGNAFHVLLPFPFLFSFSPLTSIISTSDSSSVSSTQGCADHVQTLRRCAGW